MDPCQPAGRDSGNHGLDPSWGSRGPVGGPAGRQWWPRHTTLPTRWRNWARTSPGAAPALVPPILVFVERPSGAAGSSAASDGVGPGFGLFAGAFLAGLCAQPVYLALERIMYRISPAVRPESTGHRIAQEQPLPCWMHRNADDGNPDGINMASSVCGKILSCKCRIDIFPAMPAPCSGTSSARARAFASPSRKSSSASGEGHTAPARPPQTAPEKSNRYRRSRTAFCTWDSADSQNASLCHRVGNEAQWESRHMIRRRRDKNEPCGSRKPQRSATPVRPEGWDFQVAFSCAATPESRR